MRSDPLRARWTRCGLGNRGTGDRRAIRRHHGDPARLARAGRRPAEFDPGEAGCVGFAQTRHSGGRTASGMTTWRRRSDPMDAITIQILRNKIASLVDEMHYHFYRSGYSTIIRESRDFSCVILDREGRLIVSPPMFFHAPVYRHLVGRILGVYGGGSAGINDGDVFVSNHPYEGGLPHVSDMAFVAPVFADGELVAFSGSIAHKADVGGTVPGSTSANATDLFQEGLLIPPAKICEAGARRVDGEQLILAHSRQPALVRGDGNAQIAVTQMGAARVAELCRRFGAATVTAAFAAILKGAADDMRAAIRALSEGQASAEGLLDSDGVVIDRPIRLAVTVAV